jgi:hypothetical protein
MLRIGCRFYGCERFARHLIDADQFVQFQLHRLRVAALSVLDHVIRGGQVYPVAEELLARNIPFVLASGYGDWALPESLRDQPRLTKPFRQHDPEEQVRPLMAKATASTR